MISVSDLGFGGVREFFSPFPKVACLYLLLSALHIHLYIIISSHN